MEVTTKIVKSVSLNESDLILLRREYMALVTEIKGHKDKGDNLPTRYETIDQLLLNLLE